MFVSQSAKTSGDPLSDVLAVLGARSVRGTRLEASGDWALSFQGQGRLKFVAVVHGRCWLLLPGSPPEVLEEGDVFLLSNTPFIVASDPTVQPIDGMPLYRPVGEDVVRLGEGQETVMVGGGASFADGDASFVLEALPAFLRVDRTSIGAASVARVLALLEAEVGDGRPGTSFVTDRLAEILLVEAIRAYVATGIADGIGWIAALADPRVGTALRLMHRDVARPWTTSLLAAEVGMSRSAFAQRFSQYVGRPPLDYLTRWRMVLARRRLRTSRTSIAQVAAEVGYSSQSAFTFAFKRTFGCTPRMAG
ncbi:AraC family transcriptional regulator [Methylobacterium mesophilicum]